MLNVLYKDIKKPGTNGHPNGRKMGRKSKGNTGNELNELNQLELVECDWGLSALELVRATPRLSLQTPTTFAEAARNASLRMK